MGERGADRYVWRTDKDGAVRRHAEPLPTSPQPSAEAWHPSDHIGEWALLPFRCFAEPVGGPELPARCSHGTNPRLRRIMRMVARSFLRLGALDSFERLGREVQRLQPPSHREPTR